MEGEGGERGGEGNTKVSCNLPLKIFVHDQTTAQLIMFGQEFSHKHVCILSLKKELESLFYSSQVI